MGVPDLKQNRKRIDEILLEQGTVSDSDLALALNRQKAMGGKLCSHLLECGAAPEAQIASALSLHFGIPGIALENIRVPLDVLRLLPYKVAQARRVLPFDIDTNLNVVKLACVDPTDNDLVTELGHLLKGREIQLHVAVESSLIQAINRLYGSFEELNVKEEVHHGATGELAYDTPRAGRNTKSILAVSGQPPISQLLRVLLEKDGYTVAVSDSADTAIDAIRETAYDTVFIHNAVPGNILDLSNRLRATSPQTRIRRFDSVADLLVNESQPFGHIGKLRQQLELFTSLLTIKERVPRGQSPRAVQYIDQLCHRLSLGNEERLLIQNAAQLHERAKFYYTLAAPRDFRRLIDLVIKLLQSVYYEPKAIDILRWMYADISDRRDEKVPLAVLGGNILTVIDLFFEMFPPSKRATIDKLDEFRQSIDHRINVELLPIVVDAFMAVANEETLRVSTVSRSGQIMICSNRADNMIALTDQLKAIGFRTISALSPTSFARLYRRCRPDMMILQLHGDARTVLARVSEFRNLDIDLQSAPTFVLAPRQSITDLTPLLEWGIEDILDSDTDPEQIALKIHKTWTRMSLHPMTQESGDSNLETKGKLQDLNLIELLQVLGVGRRTVKITVVPANRPNDVLEIYVDAGQIVFAQLNGFDGAEAIYVGITWDSGTWTIEPITEKELRRQNNQMSNEAILLEGCRLLDEMNTSA